MSLTFTLAGATIFSTLVTVLTTSAFEATPAPGLTKLAVFTALMAVLFLLVGAIEARRLGVRMFDQPDDGSLSYLLGFQSPASAKMGLDMLSVLGGAALITCVAHLLA